ncbi:MAG: (2Fe-2S)-binding protein [Candidatus Marinimicrobia bacterium]|jgi:carbon-monoxide dehydrogenase small subunit|nr:(2Fe-2S)-binding protein [Candidatus Neomarinimicrobiota bacterium]MDD4961689.1 (2Fe-2S)-binding protein [Candidatus Neomarinimicrobiota bacterium]MDD5709694.1 (2Fe-2S)-binding protein [Candidatus Neomarinimicrobiota bacterium]
MKRTLNINRKDIELRFDPAESLLHTLRNHGYTEVKSGCEEGECGACLVLLNGKAVNSCLIFTSSLNGDRILTAAGIGTLHEPHVIQQAFVDCGAVQCGFCTPGMVIASYALLQENPEPTEAEVRRALSGNLCRCTGYVKIVEAVLCAAERLKSER